MDTFGCRFKPVSTELFGMPIGASKTESIRNACVTFSEYHEGDEQALAKELSSRSYEPKRAKIAGPGAGHF